MDAMEGRGGSGELGLRRIKGTISRQRDSLQQLLEIIRKDLDVAVEESLTQFQRMRSEAVLHRVLARAREHRQRGAWVMRTLRRMTSVGALFWNSRAVRMLVP